MPCKFDHEFCKIWFLNTDVFDNQFCRKCSSEPCSQLWLLVKELASKNSYQGIEAKTLGVRSPFRLYTTPRQTGHLCMFQSLNPQRVGNPWRLPKEDFLYVLKTGKDNTPSCTRQKSHVQAIIYLINAKPDGKKLIEQVLKT